MTMTAAKWENLDRYVFIQFSKCQSSLWWDNTAKLLHGRRILTSFSAPVLVWKNTFTYHFIKNIKTNILIMIYLLFS